VLYVPGSLPVRGNGFLVEQALGMISLRRDESMELWQRIMQGTAYIRENTVTILLFLYVTFIVIAALLIIVITTISTQMHTNGISGVEDRSCITGQCIKKSKER